MDSKELERKKRQMVRLNHSAKDFQQALSAITFFLEEVDYTEESIPIRDLRRLHCFETTAVVSFMRPLTPTRSNTTLSFKLIGLKLSKKENQQIKRFKDFRDSYFAHSSEDTMHFRVKILKYEHQINAPLTLYDESLVLDKGDAIELQRLSQLFLTQIVATQFKIAETTPELVEMYKQPTTEFL